MANFFYYFKKIKFIKKKVNYKKKVFLASIISTVLYQVLEIKNCKS